MSFTNQGTGMISRLIQGAGGYHPLPTERPLLFGTDQLGYYGPVPAAELITGTDLANLVGMSTTGVSSNPDADWLQFAYLGKKLFIASRNTRHTVSYTALSAKQLVTGKTVVIGTKTYKVRLLTGGLYGDTASQNASEWSQMLFRICVKPVAGLPKWDDYTEAQLDLPSKLSWIQEPRGDFYAGQRGTTVDTWTYGDRNAVSAGICWRPVLELIP